MFKLGDHSQYHSNTHLKQQQKYIVSARIVTHCTLKRSCQRIFYTVPFDPNLA